ncbi:MAG: NAD(P)-dependent oxidoreductase [Acidimicrobiales bacterium]
MTVESVGFIGLGNMGSALALNLMASGLDIVTFDSDGPRRNPEGAPFMTDVAEVARRTDAVVFSLPDGAASAQVAGEVAAAADRRATHVVDTSTIGVAAARSIEALLAGAGVVYVDAPVSGGVAGARARTLAVMYAGAEQACEAVEPVLAGLSDRRYRVGDEPGMAQALKLANNFLSATALVATSEAMAFGQSVGLHMDTMLEVLNVSSGQNSATADKFPQHVLTGRYASGFANTLMSKDVHLFLDAVEELGGPSALSHATASVWERFAAAEPGVDFTRIFPFVQGP